MKPSSQRLIFQNAQEQVQMDTRQEPKKRKLYDLSGVVKCGDCAQTWSERRFLPEKKIIYYVCGNHKGNKICAVSTASMRRLWKEVYGNC